MFIQTEDTPNPNTVKFLLAELMLPNDSISLTRGSDKLQIFPVAEALFDIEEVEGIFICNNFISITKMESAHWEPLKTIILTKLLDLSSQKAQFVRSDLLQKTSENKQNKAHDDNSIVAQIKELIETRVRPAVAQDGGDILFHDFREGIVYLELHGACSGCPSSTITLKNGIESMLRHYVPEVQAVESV